MKLLIPVFIFFFISCKQENKIPKSIIKQEKMTELIWDLNRADIFISDFASKNDTAFPKLKESVKLYQEIFKLHRTSRTEFQKSIGWYQQHPLVMKTILDSLQSRRNRVMHEIDKPATEPFNIPAPDSLK